jgi:hypothetical protein
MGFERTVARTHARTHARKHACTHARTHLPEPKSPRHCSNTLAANGRHVLAKQRPFLVGGSEAGGYCGGRVCDPLARKRKGIRGRLASHLNPALEQVEHARTATTTATTTATAAATAATTTAAATPTAVVQGAPHGTTRYLPNMLVRNRRKLSALHGRRRQATAAAARHRGEGPPYH